MRDIRCIVPCLLWLTGLAPELWLSAVHADEPPPAILAKWVKGQVSDGNLALEFYDPAKPPRPFPGWTEFEFRLDYRYDYKVEFPRPRRNEKFTAVILPEFKQIEFVVKHRIQLPQTLEDFPWSSSPLGRHELDHVRVGLHPRLSLLTRQLVKNVRRVASTFEKQSEVNQKWVMLRIDNEVAGRRKAVDQLVRSINQKLDSDTSHGGKALADRDQFFEGLYLKENLDALMFPYLSDVLDLVNSQEYQDARLIFSKPETSTPTPR